MEYHVKLTAPVADLAAIAAAIEALDPAAQVDIDRPKQHLRVAAQLEASELKRLLDRAGYPVQPNQIAQQPSICCGGCGG